MVISVDWGQVKILSILGIHWIQEGSEEANDFKGVVEEWRIAKAFASRMEQRLNV